MPYDFDLDDMPPDVPEMLEPEQEQVLDTVLADDSLDSQLSEVELRLEKAQYYRAIRNQEIFEGDSSPIALAVTKEIRDFIVSRLEVLLGVKPDKDNKASKPLFEEDEVKVLKQVASKLLKKPQLMEPPKEPTVKKSPPVASPMVVKVKKAVSPPVKPQPAPVMPTAKPVELKKNKPGPKPKFASTGETVKINDVVYSKQVDNKGNVLYLGKNGQRYTKEINELGHEYMKSVTTQAKPVGVKPLPPLNSVQMEQLSQQQAAQTISKLDQKFKTAVGLAINTPAKE